MIVGQVAIARGPRQPLSYEIPEALRDRAEPGCRVLVPLGRGNRRLTGYLISVREGEAPAFAVKPVSDVLDPEPLFDSEMMSLFGFISRYYHAGLGDVIRTGLPAGLNVTDARVAELTAVGRSRADIDPLLHALSKGPRPVRGLGVPTSRLVRLARAGLLELRYELERPRVAARFTNVVSLTGDEPAAPLKPGAAPARLLELLRNEGPAETRLLRGRVPNHGPAVRRLVALGAAEVERVQVFRDPWRGEEADRDTPPELTHRQRAAVDAISRAIDSRSYEGFLLHGVTGSGKTEVYLHALEHAIRSGRGGIVLVPEIALTPQLAGRFRARFGDQVAVLHSALAEGERLDQWELIRRGERPCVVGARSAIFAPIPDLGVIVVDEEHEGSFKQDESPRYHARDVALKRGFDHGCPVVLGSATPSLETARGAAGGRLTRLDLPERIGDRALPEVELVDLRLHPPVRQDSLLSRPLIEAIAQTVARKEQAIVFLNRRGFANCFMCPPPCGFVPECPQCSVSLTFHRSRRRLTCHYCGHVAPVPAGCPQCKKNTLRQVGTGTEQVEGVLAELVPSARVARMDRDTTRGQALRRLLDRFRAREIDVLVGTQMVAKGHDFPQVTLVGVLLAEQTLKMQDFRASERTFQLLTQVAGRAGRHALPGRVLIQTCEPDHHSLQCAIDHDTHAFSERELTMRRARGFPPYSYLALLRLDAREAHVARDAAGRVARFLRQRVDHRVQLIGPNPAALERLKGRTRYHLLLRAKERATLHAAVSLLDGRPTELLGGARLAIDVDPINLL